MIGGTAIFLDCLKEDVTPWRRDFGDGTIETFIANRLFQFSCNYSDTPMSPLPRLVGGRVSKILRERSDQRMMPGERLHSIIKLE